MNETIEQKAPRPPGLVPKNVQNYVILGVAVVLILIIWMTSGNGQKSIKSPATSQSNADFSRLNQAKLEEYKNQLAAQERLLREQQALLLGQQPVPPPDAALTERDPTHGQSPTSNPQEALKTQLEMEQRKKDYSSLFSNNVALSYREGSKGTSEAEGFKEFLKLMGKNQNPDASATPETNTPGVVNPFPLFGKMHFPHYPQSSLQAPATTLASPTPSLSQVTGTESKPGIPNLKSQAPKNTDNDNKATGSSYRVLEGTVMETVLLNRINSDFYWSSPVYGDDSRLLSRSTTDLNPGRKQSPRRSRKAGQSGAKASCSGVSSAAHARWLFRQFGSV